MRGTLTFAVLTLVTVAACGSAPTAGSGAEQATGSSPIATGPTLPSPTEITPPPTEEAGTTPTTTDDARTSAVTTDEAGTSPPETDEAGTSPPTTDAAETAAEDPDTSPTWPQPVGYHEAVCDIATETILMVGGCAEAECTPVDQDWILDPQDSTWTELSPMPGGATGVVLAYDTESMAVVALQLAFDDVTNDPVDTWVLDRDTTTWTAMEPDLQPRLGAGARIVYDSGSDRIIAFGGIALDDGELSWTEGTWAYDTNTNTWTDMQPASAPPPINYFAFSYDTDSDRAVLFGLRPGDESLLWSYDHDTNTWQELERVGGPDPAPAYGRSFYHSPSDRIIYAGGSGPPATNFAARDEVWAYDLDNNSWESLGPAGLTGPIAWHTLTYIDSIDRAIVFGGGPAFDAYYGDRLFSYDPTTNVWSEIPADEVEDVPQQPRGGGSAGADRKMGL